SGTGKESSEWLLSRVNATAEPIHDKLKLAPFPHTWPQSSIIASIPGKRSKIVVIGAHQDSVNLYFPSMFRSPGADDDGSGTVTILEAFRVLAEHLKKSGQQFENTVEFHWYSAEEGGLLGSQAIFSKYEKEGWDVVAMLQQDMTGFVKKTLEAGKPESVGVITDYVDEGLTEFIKKVITEVWSSIFPSSDAISNYNV
ncbi:Leucine aminopeptidase 1, partial [Rhizina undulata]